VTGMHRSGTSLIARIANLLGVDLGPEDDLMEAKEDNPRGFWESLSISGFNDDLLAQLGGRWDDPALPDPGWEQSEDFDEWRIRARSVVEGHFTEDVAGWKDPRMSLLFPFWETVTPIDATIVSIRQPVEVWRSLNQREEMTESRAGYLWLRYTVEAILDAPRPLIVPYRSFFGGIEACVETIAGHLGLPAPQGSTWDDIRGFFDPDMRHHTDFEAPMAPEMKTAVDVFECLQTGDHSALLAFIRDAWLTDKHLDESLNGTRASDELARARFEVQEMRARLELKDRALSTYEAQIESLGHRLLERAEAPVTANDTDHSDADETNAVKSV